jgi:hypothetical protein
MDREIEIIENQKELTILIPRTGHWLVIVMTGGWCLMWLYMLYLMGADGMFFRDAEFMWYTGAFSLVWIFVLKTFLWHVRGKEKITMDKEYLRIGRLGTFLTATRKFELHLIDDFKFTEINNIPGWSKLYGFAGGKISFDYWQRPEFFGQTLGKKDAREIVTRLNDRLKNYAQQSI